MKNDKNSLSVFQSEKSVKPLTKDQEGSFKGGHHGDGFIPPPSM